LKNIIKVINILFAVIISLIIYQAKADLPEIQSRSNLSCMMGGIGYDEAKAMREEAKRWPLSIEFSEQQGTTYPWISGAELQIINQSGSTIFNETCNGPMFLAKLASGKYQLIAKYEGITKKQSVMIEDGKSAKVAFVWASKNK